MPEVLCAKLGIRAPGLARPPYPGPLGQRIFEHVSEAAWKQWIAHQTMLINEYRLQLADAKARAFLLTEAEKFFFGAAPSEL